MNRPLTLVLTEADAEALDRQAERAHRRPKDHAEHLLAEALRRGERPLEACVAALADAFDAEGERLYAEADSDAAGPRRRLLLQTRAETWFRAALRLRAALSPTDPRSALPGDRPTPA